ncbi:MAG TPA: DHA2 family efflux MFS transporter permease subunit, partial [Candidatus Paceibacterota bacterium]
TFMAVLDATIVNVALPKIMANFGVGIDKIEWVLTAYMLAMAVMLPTSAWLADKFGYKRIYFLGLMLFTVGSFLCGLAHDENMLIIARIIQGLGAGAVQPVGMAIVTREFPPHQRGVAIGFWAVAAAASASFGPMIGGYLVDYFNWQVIFDLNVPIGIIGLAVTVVIQKEYKASNMGKFDMVGFLSACLFLPLVLYALAEGNAATNSAGWHAPYILVCFAIAAIGLVVFITTELTVTNPLIDLSLFRFHNFAIANITMVLFGMGMFGSVFLLPLYMQNALGYTALQAGLVFLPVGIIQGFTSPIAGITADKVNPKIPVVIGILLLAASFYMNYFLSFLTEHRYIMISLYLRGLGMGMMFAPLSSIAISEIPRDKMAQASGLINVVRQLGGSFGVAMLTTILTVRVKFHAQAFGAGLDANSQTFSQVTAHLSQFAQQAAGSTTAEAHQQGLALLMSHLNIQAFIQGINDDFLIAAIITLVGIIPVLWLRAKKKHTYSPDQEKK